MSNTQHLTHTSQTGKPGACFLAQLFDDAGLAIAAIEPTADPTVATERARRMAACWNASAGIDTASLEALTTHHSATAHQIATIAAEELIRSEGEPSVAPDTYAIPQCQADDHMRLCIAYLVHLGMAASHETGDGYIVVMFLETP
jgi:hypothetical protein